MKVSPNTKLVSLIVACWILSSIGTAASALEKNGSNRSDAPFAWLDAFEQATSLKFFGFAQFGFSRNDTSGISTTGDTHSNLPVVGPSEEGFQLNAWQFAIEKQIVSNILPRVTPIPGPIPQEFSWGFRVEVLYGQSGLPARMHGFDTDLGVRDHQNYLAFPQVAFAIYFPIYQGVTITVGRFGAGVGRETPPEWQPNPNFFYSKSYALVSQPDQVAGALVSANLIRGNNGFLAGELGIVNGRQSWKDNNDNKSMIGALRWRDSNLQTWVNYSFMIGNEQNRPDITPQIPIARIISPRGQLRQHHSLSIMVHPSAAWEIVGEAVVGKQAGDGLPDTIDFLTGPRYTSGTYSGINGELRYRFTPLLQYGIRAEAFRDRKNITLFPVTTISSDFNAVTAGLKYVLSQHAIFRAELRHDWQSHNNGMNAFGGGSSPRQTTLSSDIVLYF
ncbi:Outer membrane beta-barrel protein [Gammaproteobacteria bacterium]